MRLTTSHFIKSLSASYITRDISLNNTTGYNYISDFNYKDLVWQSTSIYFADYRGRPGAKYDLALIRRLSLLRAERFLISVVTYFGTFVFKLIRM